MKLLCHFFQTAFFCYTQCPLLSLQIPHIEPIFKALFAYSFFPAIPDALLNKQSYHEWPQRPETTPDPWRFAHAFGKMERKKSE